MNPWTQNTIDRGKDAIRAMLWLCFALNAFMGAVFVVYFVGRFLWYAHGWCERVLFGSGW
jgi:hypothetical protein